MVEEDAVSIGTMSVCSITSFPDTSPSLQQQLPQQQHQQHQHQQHFHFQQQQQQRRATPPTIQLVPAARPRSVADPMFECCVCMDEQETPQLFASLPCECKCCKGCIKEHFTMRISEGDVSRLPCPGCRGDVSAASLRSVLTPAVFHLYITFVTREAENKRVRENEDLMWCPSPDCVTVLMRPKSCAKQQCDERPDAAAHSKNSKESASVTCPSCSKSFCFDCKMPAHKPLHTCETAIKTREKKDHAAFLKWAKQSTRACPECATLIERDKETGAGDCNHMTCAKCKTEFCWLCCRKVPPIGHFDVTNILGCPGLQYSGPDVQMTKRFSARARALSRVTLSGAKTTVKYSCFFVLLVLISPVALPVAAIRSCKK